VEHLRVAGEVLGRLAGDGQAPGFGALAEQVHGASAGVDVGEVHCEHLAVAGSQVIHEDHEELVTQPDPGARVRAASSAVTASVLMYFTGAAAEAFSRGMAARSAR